MKYCKECQKQRLRDTGAYDTKIVQLTEIINMFEGSGMTTDIKQLASYSLSEAYKIRKMCMEEKLHIKIEELYEEIERLKSNPT